MPRPQIHTYPDVMVVKGELADEANRHDTITNPMFVVEVRSKSPRNYDQGDRFTAYRTIATFREYVLVDQYCCRVERYAKTDAKKWLFQEYDSLEDVLELDSLSFTISLADIYNKVEFETEAAAS